MQREMLEASSQGMLGLEKFERALQVEVRRSGFDKPEQTSLPINIVS